MKTSGRLLSFATVVALFVLTSAPPASAEETSSWVERSNAHARVLLDALARQSPERAASLGVDGYDEEILDVAPGWRERRVRALEEAREELRERLANAREEPVRQDLEILLASATEELEGLRLERRHLLPYYDVAETVYEGLRSLLEDRIPPERRRAALVRLRRYAGREEGYEPLARRAEAEMRREWAEAGERLAPFRGEVERSLSVSDRFVAEIGELFEQYGLEGYEDDHRALVEQVETYNAFVRAEILPHARADFRLPEEVYAFRLKGYGVDMPVDELRRRAAVAYQELRSQLQALASRIAESRGLESDDYRDVIAALKAEQLEGEAILPHYEKRLDAIEAIVEREKIVTLPERDLSIRLATAAESAAAPAPFMSPPRLIGNTGEHGEFVLPLRLASGDDGAVMKVDDFTYAAASWPLAVHEGRPGHEMQFAAIVERGVSQARVIFAMTSVNVEGWALYMEEQMFPHLPLEGQFTTLWSRMVRAARAFLDPGLNLGEISRERAHHILSEELALSDALARSELERYTFRAPGQATSYFNGYLRLMELRAETELLMGERFDPQAFHDFILAQGLLPPALLRQAVLDALVPAR